MEIVHRTVDVNGLRMHLAESGTGPLVLLLHGWPETWYSWRHQISALAAAGYHVVAPDQRGYGDTDVPEAVEDYTIEHLTDDVTGLMDVLGEDKAFVIGHDWGALVSWELAKRRPERVEAVAALSIPDRFAYPLDPAVTPTAGWRAALGDAFYIVHFQQPDVADAAFAAALRQDPLGLVRRLLYSGSGDGPGWSGMVPDGGTIVDSLLEEPETLPAWVTEQDVKTYAAQFERSGFTGGLNWYRNFDRNWELSAPWRSNPVQAPALFVVGGQEAFAIPANQELITGASGSVPHLRRTVVLPGCGHWVQQERPDEVNAVLIDFLNSL
ncbi:alpha/beta hydrolase [Actinomadura sp. NPDC047616]|uniref:alpha/beta fold hydrolase n=1 Tax=Actinomadura sp. NPDC047616 TaxID=3155914 RepID=UPI0033FCC945